MLHHSVSGSSLSVPCVVLMRTMSRRICYRMKEEKPDYYVIIADVQNEHQTDKLMLVYPIKGFVLVFFFCV